MIDNHMDHLDDFIEAGSDIITTHVELGTEKVESILIIRAAGADMITPGSLIFKSEDIAKTVSWLYSL